MQFTQLFVVAGYKSLSYQFYTEKEKLLDIVTVTRKFQVTIAKDGEITIGKA